MSGIYIKLCHYNKLVAIRKGRSTRAECWLLDKCIKEITASLLVDVMVPSYLFCDQDCQHNKIVMPMMMYQVMFTIAFVTGMIGECLTFLYNFLLNLMSIFNAINQLPIIMYKLRAISYPVHLEINTTA